MYCAHGCSASAREKWTLANIGAIGGGKVALPATVKPRKPITMPQTMQTRLPDRVIFLRIITDLHFHISSRTPLARKRRRRPHIYMRTLYRRAAAVPHSSAAVTRDIHLCSEFES